MGAWTVTAEAIRNRYGQITSFLGIAFPPRFLIVPRKTLNRNVGEHRRNPDGSFSVSLVDDLHDPREIDFVLVHELTHHVLHLAGYSGPGHAWPMLALERILFNKLGWDINSIIEDVNRTWPRCTFWRTWALNVDHAVFLSDDAIADVAVMALPVHEIGGWILNQPPSHEPAFFQWEIGKKLREMHHAFIADRRSLFFLVRWTILTLLAGGLILGFVGTHTGIKLLEKSGTFFFTGGTVLLMLTSGTIFVWQKCSSALRSVRRVFSNGG